MQQQYNFTEYKNDPKAGARGYRGIRVTGAHIFITNSVAKKYLKVEPTYVGVEYDTEKKAIRLTLQTDKQEDGYVRVRRSKSYPYYVPARLTDVGLPQGRYYLRSEQEQHNATDEGVLRRYTLLFTYAEDNE